MFIKLRIFLFMIAFGFLGQESLLAQSGNSISTTKSSSLLSQDEGPFHRQLKIGPAVSYFNYQETNLMSIKGEMIGLNLEYFSKKLSLEDNWHFAAGFTYKQGNLKYDGFRKDESTLKQIPYEFNGNKINLYQIYGFVGPYLKWDDFPNTLVIPQLGINYYSLFDQNDSDPYDYTREQSYQSIPLRLDVIHMIDSSSASEIGYYFILHPSFAFKGNNKTAGQFNYDQNKGYGRTMGAYCHFFQYQILLEYEYWKVENSSFATNSNNSAALVSSSTNYEPQNETSYLTLSLSYMF
ncbi:MAG: hypothetical protein QE271_00570 [Bacteriovoracaceae bacterium]|nr:hypothetical protein [Bacteriovoracaceae bacterium]